jgi:tRNA G18 (ribose-2'-O)-methylase SpoU
MNSSRDSAELPDRLPGRLSADATGPISVDDVDDPRLADYRHLKDRDLSAEGGRFIAESARVVRRLCESGLCVHSILVTPPRLASLGDVLGTLDCPVYVAAQSLLNEIAGFHVHRGCLAVGERPRSATVPAGAQTVVVLEDLVDADNLGGCVRNAAAFGADALVLSPRCADPFYRKAIRVAIGATFTMPIVRLAAWPDDLRDLKQRFGFALLGAVLDPNATPLGAVDCPPKVALLLGSEGPGLSPAARAACDRLITIPMAPGADSLNVATAGAVALFHLRQLRQLRAPPDQRRRS